MWRDFVGSCWLGPGCPVLRVDTRENPMGKNGVMTVPVVCIVLSHLTKSTIITSTDVGSSKIFNNRTERRKARQILDKM
jgi:hypothetical protein